MSQINHPLLVNENFKGLTFYYFCPRSTLEEKKKIGLDIEKYQGVRFYY